MKIILSVCISFNIYAVDCQKEAREIAESYNLPIEECFKIHLNGKITNHHEPGVSKCLS